MAVEASPSEHGSSAGPAGFAALSALAARAAELAKRGASEGFRALRRGALRCGIAWNLVDADAFLGREGRRYGVRRLGSALASEDAAMASMLLRAGADPSLPCRWGKSGMEIAASEGMIDMLALMLDLGAGPEAGRAPILAISGRSARIDGIAGRSSAIARLLLAAGADPCRLGPEGGALHAAARKTADDPTLAKLLLRCGADPDARDPQGRTPLHLAAIAGNGGSMRALLEAGADPNAWDDEGATPLMRACSGGSRDRIRLLLAWGADLMARDDSWNGCVAYARQAGAPELSMEVEAMIHARMERAELAKQLPTAKNRTSKPMRM